MKFRIQKKSTVSHLVIGVLALFSCATSTAQHSKAGFKKIFDGKTLHGWSGDTLHWHAGNGSIIGEVTAANPLKTNTFLIWQGGKPADFEFKAEFKITKSGNSGVNYRSELFENIPYALKGYQADIDGENVYTGQNYEERGRGFLAKRGENAVLEKDKEPVIATTIGNSDSLKTLIHFEGWNTLLIVAKGNRMSHYINGKLMSDVIDNDQDKRKSSGLLGLQAHVGPPMKVEYKNIYIKQ